MKLITGNNSIIIDYTVSLGGDTLPRTPIQPTPEVSQDTKKGRKYVTVTRMKVISEEQEIDTLQLFPI